MTQASGEGEEVAEANDKVTEGTVDEQGRGKEKNNSSTYKSCRGTIVHSVGLENKIKKNRRKK